MTSSDLTLQVFDPGIIPVTIAYVLLTLACGVLAHSRGSRAAWLATTGFGYLAANSLWWSTQMMVVWFVPLGVGGADVTVTVTSAGLWSWCLQIGALSLAALGLAVFAWQQREHR